MAFTTSPMRNAEQVNGAPKAQHASRSGSVGCRSGGGGLSPTRGCGAASASGEGASRNCVPTACRGGTCCCAAGRVVLHCLLRCLPEGQPHCGIVLFGVRSALVLGARHHKVLFEQGAVERHEAAHQARHEAAASQVEALARHAARAVARQLVAHPKGAGVQEEHVRAHGALLLVQRRAQAKERVVGIALGLLALGPPTKVARLLLPTLLVQQHAVRDILVVEGKLVRLSGHELQKELTTRARRKSRDFASRAERGREAARSASSSKSRARWRRRGRRRRRRGRRRWQGRPQCAAGVLVGAALFDGLPVQRRKGALDLVDILPCRRAVLEGADDRDQLSRACGMRQSLATPCCAPRRLRDRMRKYLRAARPCKNATPTANAVAGAPLAATAPEPMRRRVEEAHEVVRRTLEVGRHEHGHRGGARRQRVVGGRRLIVRIQQFALLAVGQTRQVVLAFEHEEAVARDKGVLVELCLQGDGFETRHRRIDARGRGEPAGEPAPKSVAQRRAAGGRHRRGRPLRQIMHASRISSTMAASATDETR